MLMKCFIYFIISSASLPNVCNESACDTDFVWVGILVKIGYYKFGIL